jgi:diaminohydroxyphosphoribosylaminopyrimidine deaminase/5-amino-6-(5-phosphoribosylamino)uracil reductase
MFPDPAHMSHALRLARKGVGRTSPNPAVGAVIVKGGRVVGEGWHSAAGKPHAEIEAIAAAGPKARGADLYVTLEPCSHTGRTGPCAVAVREAGVARVAAAMEDPNPLVSGKGFALLRDAGIEVRSGILEEEARRLNRAWIRFVSTGIPFVTLKIATTLDGQIAGASGESRWITGEASRLEVHRMRAVSDAVLVGGTTAVQDDPLLTCRIRGRRNPVRVVLTSRPERLAVLRMFADRSAANLVAVPEGIGASRSRALEEAGAEILRIPARDGRIAAGDLLSALGKRGIASLLVEGGGVVAGNFLRESAVDRLVMFIAPAMFGEGIRSVSGWSARTPAEGRRFGIAKVRRMGEDLMLEALPKPEGDPCSRG